jgi:hypothetical protein
MLKIWQVKIRYCDALFFAGNARPQAFSTDKIFKRVRTGSHFLNKINKQQHSQGAYLKILGTHFFCAFFKEKQKTYVWIYIPSEFYPSAQELAASNLDLNSQSQLLEQFVMSRSKPLRAKSWLAAWKKKDWMQRLFGRILKPSIVCLGVEKWIASLAG